MSLYKRCITSFLCSVMITSCVSQQQLSNPNLTETTSIQVGDTVLNKQAGHWQIVYPISWPANDEEIIQLLTLASRNYDSSKRSNTEDMIIRFYNDDILLLKEAFNRGELNSSPLPASCSSQTYNCFIQRTLLTNTSFIASMDARDETSKTSITLNDIEQKTVEGILTAPIISEVSHIQTPLSLEFSFKVFLHSTLHPEASYTLYFKMMDDECLVAKEREQFVAHIDKESCSTIWSFIRKAN